LLVDRGAHRLLLPVALFAQHLDLTVECHAAHRLAHQLAQQVHGFAVRHRGDELQHDGLQARAQHASTGPAQSLIQQKAAAFACGDPIEPPAYRHWSHACQDDPRPVSINPPAGFALLIQGIVDEGKQSASELPRTDARGPKTTDSQSSPAPKAVTGGAN
jgi:hypothetical protein